MDRMVDPPIPTSVPNAVERFIRGNVTASPEIAIAPTPCPMNMLSIMLYSDDAVIAMMAGRAYSLSSLPIGSVPSSTGTALLSAIILPPPL